MSKNDWRISPNAISEPKIIGISVKKYNQAISKIERLEKELKYARECNEVQNKYWSGIGVQRNTYLLKKEALEERVKELETELYFCNRNKRVGEIVDERTKVETR